MSRILLTEEVMDNLHTVDMIIATEGLPIRIAGKMRYGSVYEGDCGAKYMFFGKCAVHSGKGHSSSEEYATHTSRYHSIPILKWDKVFILPEEENDSIDFDVWTETYERMEIVND